MWVIWNFEIFACRIDCDIGTNVYIDSDPVDHFAIYNLAKLFAKQCKTW